MDGTLRHSTDRSRAIARALGIALAGCVLSLGLAHPAQAALLSIASVSGGSNSSIFWSNGAEGIFLNDSCAGTGGSCVSVTAPGPLLGAYNYFSLSVSQVESTGPATLNAGGIYSEQYALSTGSQADDGTITLGNGGPGNTSPTILSADVTGYTIFAPNNGDTAQIQLDLSNILIGAGVTGFTQEDVASAYLLFSGLTAAPVSIQGGQFTGSIEIDWSGAVSSTPYAPAPVPLPASAWLLLGALGAFGAYGAMRTAHLS